MLISQIGDIFKYVRINEEYVNNDMLTKHFKHISVTVASLATRILHKLSCVVSHDRKVARWERIIQMATLTELGGQEGS